MRVFLLNIWKFILHYRFFFFVGLKFETFWPNQIALLYPHHNNTKKQRIYFFLLCVFLVANYFSADCHWVAVCVFFSFENCCFNFDQPKRRKTKTHCTLYNAIVITSRGYHCSNQKIGREKNFWIKRKIIAKTPIQL